MADGKPVAACARGHVLKGIGILCQVPGCRKFILFEPEVYQTKKAATFLRVSLLVLSSMAVLLLSGLTNNIWPLYGFFVIGVVLLYSAIFSRGSTLRPTTWILTFFAVAWLVWQGFSGLIGLTAGDSWLLQLGTRLLPLVVWLLFSGFMYILAVKKSFPAIAKPAAYFLTVSSFTFGFWGVWLVLLESELVTSGLYRLAIGFGLLLPLVCVVLLIVQAPQQTVTTPDPHGPEGSTITDGRWNLFALWLVVLAAYLVLIEPLIQALAFLLGRFLPLAVGREPLEDVTVDWLGGAGWRAVVTSALLMIAITLVAVRSVMEVTAKEAEPSDDTSGSAEQLSEAAQQVSAAEPLTDAIRDTALHNFRETGYAGTFYGKIGLQFARNVFRTARHVFNVAVPISIFTALSLLVVLVLSAFQDYRSHGPFFASISLWGTGLTTWIIMVVACGVAFELAPYQKRGAGRPMVETGAATLLGGLLYFLISLISVALLPLWLYPRDSSAKLGGFVPGKIYFTNLLISMAALTLLVVLTLIIKDRLKVQGERAKRQKLYNHSYTFAAIVLLVLGGAALYFALPPIQVAATYVSSAYVTSADAELRKQIPASVSSSCTRDHVMLEGYQSGFICTRDGIELTYHLFASQSQLNQWYYEAVAYRDITQGAGKCGTTDPAEGAYDSGPARGQLACYTDRGRSWLIWTNPESRTLGIARSSGHTLPDLYARWAAGAFA